MRGRSILFGAWLLVALVVPARAAVDLEFRFGHGGRAVAGAITPLRVTLRSRETEPLGVTLTARVGRLMLSGEIGTVRDVLGPGAEKEFTFLLRAGYRVQPSLRLELDRATVVRPEGGKPTKATSDYETDLPLETTSRAVVQAAAPAILAIGRHAALLPRPQTAASVLTITEAEMPRVWLAYDGIETVYWREPGATEPIDRAAVRALLRWVELGGRLVISSTRRPRVMDGTALERALPATVGDPDPAFDYLTIAGALVPGGLEAENRPPTVASYFVPLRVRRGRVERQVGDLPLAVEAPFGLGQVVVLAWDPARFEESQGRLALAVLRPFAPEFFTEEALSRGPSSFFLAGDDVVGALTALLRAGSVKKPPMGLLSLFMILYVLAVGPLDYFFLKKRGWLKYSALTFLGLAVVFSVAAWIVSFWLFAGGEAVNRVTLTDIVSDPAGGGGDHLALHDLAGFYAPRGGTFSLDVEADTSHSSDLPLSWGAMIGAGGGLPHDPIRLDMLDVARPKGRISMPFRSIRSIRTEVYREHTVPLDVRVDERDSVSVRNGLPFELRDATLVTPDGWFAFGDLEAGAESTLPWAGISGGRRPFRHRLGNGSLFPDADRIAELGEADLPADMVPEVARALLAMSVFSRYGPRQDLDDEARIRLYRQFGVDRGGVLSDGGSLFLAWTDERDPFSLPGGDSGGFSMTILRKVIRP